MPALAFADSAFKKDEITSPEDLHNLEIPHFKELLSIQWRSEVRDTPTFRRCENSAISTKPMTFLDFNHYTKRPGVLSADLYY